MEAMESKLRFIFSRKTNGDEFCVRMRRLAYKLDVITVNDILNDQKKGKITDGFRYGYSRKDVKKVKPEKADGGWVVIFPKPELIVRDEHGHWTTESELAQKRYSGEQLCMFREDGQLNEMKGE